MRELSLHVLDLMQNSIRAQADTIILEVSELVSLNKLIITIKDNGKGMSEEMARQVINPFVTSRTHRKVGLGIPFVAQMSKECNGKLEIASKEGEGTELVIELEYNHIDRLPLGDIAETIATLILAKSEIHYLYIYKYEEVEFVFDTQVIKEMLEDVPIDALEIIDWIKGYIRQGMLECKK